MKKLKPIWKSVNRRSNNLMKIWKIYKSKFQKSKNKQIDYYRKSTNRNCKRKKLLIVLKERKLASQMKKMFCWGGHGIVANKQEKVNTLPRLNSFCMHSLYHAISCRPMSKLNVMFLESIGTKRCLN